ncbi:hypothetical protein PWT90_08788 [Aphanocladium album]|nr:hypothetical protein PWT90_08788 [Aphanocladium album]
MAGKIRQPIDEKAFAKYIDENVPEIKTPLQLKQFGFGQSNPTYQITDAVGSKFVMRKKPPGKLVSKTAHRVDREYRIIHALRDTDIAVPKAYSLCEDESVIGTPFYIMEFLDGRIFEDFTMPGVSADERTALWKAAIELLARFHMVDFRKLGLERFGKHSGFYGRQVQTWTTICQAQAQVADVETQEPVGQLPHFDEIMEFFADVKQQPKDRATLVHGDYKIDNVVFHKTEPRIIGILDWEMATVGHPLSDVCNFLTQFYLARSPGNAHPESKAFLPGQTPGMPQPEQIIKWYSAVSDYNPLPELNWGAAFSIYKLAGVLQGIAARYAMRQASSAQAKSHADGRIPMAELGWQLAQLAQKGGRPHLDVKRRHNGCLPFRDYGKPSTERVSRSTQHYSPTRVAHLRAEAEKLKGRKDQKKYRMAEQQTTRRRITLPPTDQERRPLLSRMYTDHGEDDRLYSCVTNPHSHLPVYTTIHRIRRDITSVVEDYLSLEQLRDVRINITVVRPLVDKFYELNDLSIVYCLLVNRAQFLDEESYSSNRQNVNWTRATLCEIIATRILRRFGEDHDGSEGLLFLAHVLVAGFDPYQNAPRHVRAAAERRIWRGYHRTLPSLEVAILTESKHFLSSTTCQKVVAAIYEGRIIYTPSTQWDIIPDHYKLKPISLYEPRDSPLLNQYRLIVPRTRNILESIQFAILLALYTALMVARDKEDLTVTECAFAVYAFGWGLDQFATLIAHGWNVYTQNLWSFLDVGFVLVYSVYLILRVHGFRTGMPGPGEQSFDVLALAAPLLIPRLAFTLLSDNLVFLSLRSMMADFFLLTALSAWCFFGFLLSLLWLGDGMHPWLTISKWMIFIWFGLDGTGIQRSAEFHWLLGPSLMVAFAFLGNTLFLTILVSMLSNTFSIISSNATAEIQFRRAVLTLEGVKADAIFAYQPPFNILAVFIFLPLKFIVSPRWFHKIHVATVRLVNLPLLLIIAVAERRIIWDSHDYKYTPGGADENASRKWFWQKWQLSASRYIRSVFDDPPSEDVLDSISVDDSMTHHLIRRQFTRQNTGGSMEVRKPSRRDSTFPGIRKKLRRSFSAAEQEQESLEGRLQAMEKAMSRMEVMLAQLLPDTQVGGEEEDDDGNVALGDSAIDATSEESYAAASTPGIDGADSGFAAESSSRGV